MLGLSIQSYSLQCAVQCDYGKSIMSLYTAREVVPSLPHTKLLIIIMHPQIPIFSIFQFFSKPVGFVRISEREVPHIFTK